MTGNPHSRRTTTTPPLTVWPCRQNTDEPSGEITPALAQRIIEEFSPRDGLVIDPFSTDPAIITAAVSTGRCAITVSTSTERLTRARRAVERLPQPKGTAEFRVGDRRHLAGTLSDVSGWADLIVSCPPYAFTGAAGGSHRQTGSDLIAGCAGLLKPGGMLVTVTTSTPCRDGHVIDLASLTVVLAREAGLRYLQHIIAVRCPVTGSALTPPTESSSDGSRAQTVHSDVLAFARTQGPENGAAR